MYVQCSIQRVGLRSVMKVIVRERSPEIVCLRVGRCRHRHCGCKEVECRCLVPVLRQAESQPSHAIQVNTASRRNGAIKGRLRSFYVPSVAGPHTITSKSFGMWRNAARRPCQICRHAIGQHDGTGCSNKKAMAKGICLKDT